MGSASNVEKHAALMMESALRDELRGRGLPDYFDIEVYASGASNAAKPKIRLPKYAASILLQVLQGTWKPSS